MAVTVTSCTRAVLRDQAERPHGGDSHLLCDDRSPRSSGAPCEQFSTPVMLDPMAKTSPASYDIAIQWPRKRDDWYAVVGRGSVPLYARPHGFDPTFTTVWVVSRGKIVGSFKASEIRERKLRLLTGGPAKKGVELTVRPGTRHKLKSPRLVAEISDPDRVRTPWPGGSFKHLTPGASAFVRSPSSPPTVKYIEIQREWLKEAQVQRSSIEDHTAYGREARLVVQYANWLRQRRGKSVLRRHKITLNDGTVLLSDAWDDDRNLLIEAKAGTDRPSIRMAIGQLIDYSHNLPNTPSLGVLLPSKPSKHIFTLLKTQSIAVIWQTASGEFRDSLDGEISG